LLSLGQSLLYPSQYSDSSQSPALGRQIISFEILLSIGQSLLFPSQYSALSQIPPDGRHTT